MIFTKIGYIGFTGKQVINHILDYWPDSQLLYNRVFFRVILNDTGKVFSG
jgi:hypothetical protein